MPNELNLHEIKIPAPLMSLEVRRKLQQMTRDLMEMPLDHSDPEIIQTRKYVLFSAVLRALKNAYLLGQAERT